MRQTPEPVPFNKPFLIGAEFDNILEAIRHQQLAGNGEFTRLCHSWLEERIGSRKALLTHSCTAALEMAALLFQVGPEDEVILPSFTFVSTANAFALRGARLRFVDVREDTLCMDAAQVEAAIGPRTRVVVPVHYAGVSCDMEAMMRLAEAHSLQVVEDAAQGIQATFRGWALGSMGNLGTLSFHETKNCISGEGGALLVNDERLLERAEILWEKGTNRSRFLRGQTDKYTWVDLGSSFLPSELTAAFLFAQLSKAEEITTRRLQLWGRYREGLEALEAAGDLRLPVIPADCRHNAHMFYVLTADLDARTRLIRHLASRGIQAVFHYVPLHTSPMGRSLAPGTAPLPVTEDVADRLVRLPLFFQLGEAQQDRVLAEVCAFYGRPGGGGR